MEYCRVYWITSRLNQDCIVSRLSQDCIQLDLRMRVWTERVLKTKHLRFEKSYISIKPKARRFVIAWLLFKRSSTARCRRSMIDCFGFKFGKVNHLTKVFA